MDLPVSRREILGVGGTAAALSVAGCSSFSTDEESTLHEVMVVPEIDQAELQAVQEEAQATQQQVQEDLQEGEIDEEEAQQIFEDAQADVEETQQQLLADALSEIEAHADDVEGLSIEDTELESGVALLEGSGDSLIELLSVDAVQALLDSSRYEDL